jgi:5-(carboxyamino)imidazole ribonucleotide synthase
VRLGVLGGGQLGRMLALAGAPLGISCRFLDPKEQPCAAAYGEHVRAAYDDETAIERFCDGLDAVTYEFENVPAESAGLIARRLPLRPGVGSLEMTQDRAIEKAFVRDSAGRTAPYAEVEGPDGLEVALKGIGRPAVLKTRRFGYDGKGQCVIRDGDDLAEARRIAADRPCVLEGFVSFTRELSIVTARAKSGETASLPVVENIHRGGILRATVAPAPERDGVAAEADRIGRKIAESLGHVGALCVELFETPEGLIVNEIAPRVHNSGHWSIDGARTSQFENHLRAVVGWPLGPPESLAPSVMLNLVGDAPSAEEILSIDPEARVHLYGKSPKPDRKVGHVTLLDLDRGSLARRVRAMADLPGVDRESALAAAERAGVS